MAEVRVGVEHLQDFVVAVLTAHGVREGDAGVTATRVRRAGSRAGLAPTGPATPATRA